MKTLARQSDLFAGRSKGPGFAALVEERLGKNRKAILRVTDVCEALDLSRTKVIEMIECGRLQAVNMNTGIVVPVDAGRPGIGTRPLTPCYRVTHEAVMDYAKSVEEGV